MNQIPLSYVHGYDEHESARLEAQAWSVRNLLHRDTQYAPGSRVLEVACGTGEQTLRLARNSPEATIVAFDRNDRSLGEAREKVAAAGLSNVEFHRADLFDLPFALQSFDHAFVCFVLEHLADPGAGLGMIRRCLAPGGSITVFEGDHGSTFFHPDSEWAHSAIGCQVELQRRTGGNAMIGRSIYPLLQAAGFVGIAVTPRMVYVDGSRPELIDAFTRRTFTAMIERVRDHAIRSGLTSAESFDRGIRDLYRTATPEGVFCYTFFKATALVSA